MTEPRQCDRDAAAMLRNVVSHATGGHVDLAETGPLTTNDISVRISRHHNAIWKNAQESAREQTVATT